MSASQAFFILFLVVAGIALVIWIFLRGWSPEQLPLWAGLIWGLIAMIKFVPAMLPASIRWSDNLSIVQVTLGVVVLVLSLKSLILLLRHGSNLSDSQRWAAYLGIAPLVIGVLMVLIFFWIAGSLGAKK